MFDALCIALRVTICCLVLAFFLFIPFKNRLRYSHLKTGLITAVFIGVTVAVTIFFLIPDTYLSDYSTYGILLWIACAVLFYRAVIENKSLEVLFIVLVVLNLYVNVAAIARIILIAADIHLPVHLAELILTVAVLTLYTPLLWVLTARLYQQVANFCVNLPVWKFIWIIPALTYLIFFVKIIQDYWKVSVVPGADDIVFIILWSFFTYAVFYITLQLMIQTYKGMTAAQQAELASSQLDMQKERYEKLLDHIDKMARLKHDWRHHLVCISGFMENENVAGLKEYLRQLLPEYMEEEERPICQNHVVDAILRHYAAMAKAHGIRMDIQAQVGVVSVVPDMDLCIIFGNLVENAVEACMGGEPDQQFIEIKALTKGRQLIVVIKNTYQRHVAVENQVYYSTKHDGAGIGLPSVKNTVEKYHGIMKVEYDAACFCVSVFLNAPAEETLK